MLSLGIVEFGRAVWTYSTLAYASREAVRYAIVRGATSGRPASEDQVEDVVRAHVTGLNPEELEVSTTWTPDNEPGSTVQVTVEHEFHPIIPAGMAFELQATSRMVVAY